MHSETTSITKKRRETAQNAWNALGIQSPALILSLYLFIYGEKMNDELQLALYLVIITNALIGAHPLFKALNSRFRNVKERVPKASDFQRAIEIFKMGVDDDQIRLTFHFLFSLLTPSTTANSGLLLTGDIVETPDAIIVPWLEDVDDASLVLANERAIATDRLSNEFTDQRLRDTLHSDGRRIRVSETIKSIGFSSLDSHPGLLYLILEAAESINIERSPNVLVELVTTITDFILSVISQEEARRGHILRLRDQAVTESIRARVSKVPNEAAILRGEFSQTTALDLELDPAQLIYLIRQVISAGVKAVPEVRNAVRGSIASLTTAVTSINRGRLHSIRSGMLQALQTHSETDSNRAISHYELAMKLGLGGAAVETIQANGHLGRVLITLKPGFELQNIVPLIIRVLMTSSSSSLIAVASGNITLCGAHQARWTGASPTIHYVFNTDELQEWQSSNIRTVESLESINRASQHAPSFHTPLLQQPV